MKKFFERIILKKRKIKYLLSIIRSLKMDLYLQNTCFRHKDYEEAKAITQEAIDFLEELGL